MEERILAMFVIFSLILIILISVGVNAYDCYQESYNYINQTGIDGNCGLNYDGSDYENGLWINVSLLNDGNWNTYSNAVGQVNANIQINYSKPIFSIDSAKLKFINDLFQPINISIPPGCLLGINNKIILTISSRGYKDGYYTHYECFNLVTNARETIYLSPVYPDGLGFRVYETAIIWHFDNQPMFIYEEKIAILEKNISILNQRMNNYEENLSNYNQRIYALEFWKQSINLTIVSFQNSVNTIMNILSIYGNKISILENKFTLCLNDSECNDNNLYTYDQCNNPGTINSNCSHIIINCVTNNDCGITGFIGTEFCSNRSIYKNFQNSTCLNPGTLKSLCNSIIKQILVNNCGNKDCINGQCIEPKDDCTTKPNDYYCNGYYSKYKDYYACGSGEGTSISCNPGKCLYTLKSIKCLTGNCNNSTGKCP